MYKVYIRLIDILLHSKFHGIGLRIRLNECLLLQLVRCFVAHRNSNYLFSLNLIVEVAYILNTAQAITPHIYRMIDVLYVQV